MTERITSSSELRSFVADNTGRRKIDTEASLELHVRAASQLDMLSEQVADLQARLTDAGTSAPAVVAPVGSDASESAMMLLRNAQTTADETLAETSRMHAEASAALENAESHAQQQADAALDVARSQARELVEAAEIEAADLVSTNQKAADRAQFIQRQYVEKASTVRREAEALVEFTRQVESLAGTELDEDLPIVSDPAPATTPADEAVEEVASPIVEDEPVDAVEAVEEPKAGEEPLPASQFLPPPPPPPASDVLDFTEADLDAAPDDDSIDDELFGDDVVDIRDDIQERA